MDPTDALTALIESLEPTPTDTPGDRERLREEALEALEALSIWLADGGSLPDVQRALVAAGYVEEGG